MDDRKHINEVPYEQRGKYSVYFYEQNTKMGICYDEENPQTNNLWQLTNPNARRLPFFMLQLGFIIIVTRVLMLTCKPLRQPRFLAQIMGGILLGTSGLGVLSPQASMFLNPYEAALFWETMANLGLTFYMFLVGLEMDLTPIRRIGKMALIVALAGIVVPSCAGVGLHYMVSLYEHVDGNRAEGFASFFWGIALSITSFPDLARMLSDLKIMYTDLGKTALAAAVISDISCWLLLVVAISLVNAGKNLNVVVPVMVCTATFWYMARPFISWVVKQTESEESSVEGKYTDKHVYFILTAVLLFGYITELCGAHSMFGAFAFGLMIPSGELGTLVMEKIEEFVIGILLPPIFLLSGLRTDFPFIFKLFTVGQVALVIALACSAKIVSTFLVCMYFKCPKRDSFVLGLLMNTKGVLVLIVLNEGRYLKCFDHATYPLLMLALLVMTVMIGPIVSVTHKSKRNLNPYRCRNLERSKREAVLRVLTCVHSPKNLSGMINLLGISNATRNSPIIVFAAHLVELAGRSTAMLIFHDKNKTNKLNEIGNNANREKAAAEQIINAFEALEKLNHAVSIQPLTVVSPYSSMHKDVSNFAFDKQANIILMPFHRQTNASGGWVDENAQHRLVNKNLLLNAPCSVGLVVDRGLPSPLCLDPKTGGFKDCRIAMLFIEGPDDREALAYAWRIAGTPHIKLTVVRFVPDSISRSFKFAEDEELDILATTREKEMRDNEKQIDDDYINEFRFKTMNDKTISYIEKQVDGGDEIVTVITSVYNNFEFDLYVVGRGHAKTCSLTSGLSNWSDYPELGPIGETLVSLETKSPASVLVMQQFSTSNNLNSLSRMKSFAQCIFGDCTANLQPPETFVHHRRISLVDDDDDDDVGY